MKNFTLILLGLLCSIQSFAQKKFFITGANSSVEADLRLWVLDNNYLLAPDRANTDYIIECNEIKRAAFKNNFIYISLLDNTGNLIGQTKKAYARNKTKSFVMLAELELDGIVKKKIAADDVDTFKAAFSDTLLTITRSKTETVTTRSTVSFTGKAGESIDYFFTFENEPIKATFKDYLSKDVKKGSLPSTAMVEVNILPDTTIKLTMTYKVQLFYKLKAETEFKKDKLFTIKVLAQEPTPQIPFHKNELILFAGTTYDHFNPSNKISGLSIEPMFTTMVNENLWLRFGIYLHPNFSRDTLVHRNTTYYRLDDSDLVDNQSKIGRFSETMNRGEKIQSIGFYTDVIFPVKPKIENKRGMRLAPAIHLEFAKRITTPTVRFSSSKIDTIQYSRQVIIDPRMLKRAFPDTSNRIVQKYTLNQAIVSGGIFTEVNLSNIYLFFQPIFGARFQYAVTADLRDSPIISKLTSGYKFSIRYKEIISISIDHRDFLAKDEYLNISIGVPTTIASIFKK
ncbi:hypothetical protein [Dyadobacter sp. CY312]|uniref:hypothetical protein n=1 Tax=Dyadobacter sp. CY312 TaxID=2907303 RepID=UPI001F32ED49|nr:hypothetical protein [Dyadobacter sp. CY312]MCE7044667.1 hypothetical protein [Dyadobacter sp. CY312]